MCFRPSGQYRPGRRSKGRCHWLRKWRRVVGIVAPALLRAQPRTPEFAPFSPDDRQMTQRAGAENGHSFPPVRTMLIRDIMSERPVSVSLDDHLDVVKDIFDHAKFHHLLVIEEGKLIGVISDRDLLKAISPHIGTNRYTTRDLETLAQPVHRIVTRKPLTLTADASVDEAVAIFNAHNISCIPIVDDGGAAVGIVSWRDILKSLSALRREAAAAVPA